MIRDFKKVNTIALIVIWALYCISLMLPALTTSNGEKIGGFNILLIGWLGVFAGMMSVAACWYANLFFIYISIQTLRGKKTSISHLFMLLLAIRAFFPMEMMLDEGGETYIVTEHNLGFYFWFSAIVLLSTLVFINWRLCRNRDN
ncbi:hypothetical protein CN692_20000 [Bacillus sp. AFS002410]|uniref:hypothetical protein n=1 Tax=Bacillus sp. AFS002410 TaxID=2033481 RepID=UPI000BF15B19|nr:hypothetical protein [Bacillus sp. AFS002410]PEJ54382.1 hypothetical protein CN692_20000 [Bacillus sp. AFS002410]